MKFGEIPIGEKVKSVPYTITKNEIIAFATEFDPQYLHIEEEKAKESMFKGIIASGMHTLSLSFKLLHQVFDLGDDLIAGTGMNALKLVKPVYPEDKLYITSEVIGKNERKKAGEITLLITTYKNEGVKVLQYESTILVRK